MHCLSKYCVGGFLPGGTLLRERRNRQETICNMNLDVSVRHGDLGFAFICFDWYIRHAVGDLQLRYLCIKKTRHTDPPPSL